MEELAGVLDAVRRGRFPAGLYADGALHERERTHVFAHAWQFLAHESEIRAPGDYVLRRILDDSFIVTRGEAGDVHVLLNLCRHKGMQVCQTEAGNAATFRCPYHAWTYRNSGELIGVPFHVDAYGGEAGFSKAEHPLVSAPRVGIYRGFIFASLDAHAEPLEEYLGDFRFYFDLYTHQSDAGIELYGPQRWRVRCNWKIGAENFSGDSYHTPHTHASVVDIGLFREPTGSKRKEGALYWAGPGGGTTYKLPHDGFEENLRYIGYPTEMIARMRGTWSPSQRAMVADARFMVSAATVFPNLSFVHNWPRVERGDDVTPFISVRLWQPISATETECWSWFAVDAHAPDDFKQRSHKGYLMCFGTSGMFEQDDVENWTSITTAARGAFASRVELDTTMGMTVDGGALGPKPAQWPGPGTAHIGYGEYNQRALLRLWADRMAART